MAALRCGKFCGKQVLLKLSTTNSVFPARSLCAFADAHLGSTTARAFIKQMEDSSAAARIAAGYYHGTSEAVRSLAAGYGASGVGRSLTQWQELVGSTALANVLMSIDKSALCFAQQAEEWSGASALAKELDKTRQMMLQPEWAFLTGSAARAAQEQLLGLYDTQSVYQQLFKQMEYFAASDATPPDEEAESYFQVIKGYLASAFKGVTHISPGEWFAIVHLLFGVMMEIHTLHALQAVQGQLSEVKTKVSTLEDREKHTAAVVDALTAKLDALMEEIAEQKEGSQSIKWAARGNLVVVRARLQSGPKVIGALLPFQS